SCYVLLSIFFFNDPAPPDIYTLSLHDALPILIEDGRILLRAAEPAGVARGLTTLVQLVATAPSAGPGETGADEIRVPSARILDRSEEHTSELQSPCNLVCRLLLEKKKKKKQEY